MRPANTRLDVIFLTLFLLQFSKPWPYIAGVGLCYFPTTIFAKKFIFLSASVE
jgi:hypothetical protein